MRSLIYTIITFFIISLILKMEKKESNDIEKIIDRVKEENFISSNMRMKEKENRLPNQNKIIATQESKITKIDHKKIERLIDEQINNEERKIINSKFEQKNEVYVGLGTKKTNNNPIYNEVAISVKGDDGSAIVVYLDRPLNLRKE